MNFDIFKTLACESTKNVQSFSHFVSYAEALMNANLFLMKEGNKKQFEAIWFEMELVNALALSDWEQCGKPEVWEKWYQQYYDDISYFEDAQNTVTRFIEMIETLIPNIIWLKFNG